MVLVSSEQSVEDKEPSWLAVLEMLLASVLLLWGFGTSGFDDLAFPQLVFMSVILAPLALIRTHWSTSFGLMLYGRVINLVRRIEEWRDQPNLTKIGREMRLLCGFAFFLFAIPLLMVGIRAISWIYGACRHPLDSVFSIPENWFRTVLLLDLFHPPEPVPDVETSNNVDRMYRAREHIHGLFQQLRNRFHDRSIGFKIVYAVGWFTQWALMFLPGLAVRWALKSSWLIWSPIIYSAHRSSPLTTSTDERLDEIRTGTFERFKRVLAGFHLACFIIYLLILSHTMSSTRDWHWLVTDLLHLLQVVFRWSSFLDFDVSGVFLLRVWGFFAFINILITILLWKLGEDAYRKDRLQSPNRISDGLIHGLLFIRGSLGVMLVFRGIYEVGKNLSLPLYIRIIW